MMLSASDGFEPERVVWSLLAPCKESLSENGANIKEAEPRDKKTNKILMTLFVYLCLKTLQLHGPINSLLA